MTDFKESNMDLSLSDLTLKPLPSFLSNPAPPVQDHQPSNSIQGKGGKPNEDRSLLGNGQREKLSFHPLDTHGRNDSTPVFRRNASPSISSNVGASNIDELLQQFRKELDSIKSIDVNTPKMERVSQSSQDNSTRRLQKQEGHFSQHVKELQQSNSHHPVPKFDVKPEPIQPPQLNQQRNTSFLPHTQDSFAFHRSSNIQPSNHEKLQSHQFSSRSPFRTTLGSAFRVSENPPSDIRNQLHQLKEPNFQSNLPPQNNSNPHEINSLKYENMQLKSELAKVNSKISSMDARLEGLQRNVDMIISMLSKNNNSSGLSRFH